MTERAHETLSWTLWRQELGSSRLTRVASYGSREEAWQARESSQAKDSAANYWIGPERPISLLG